MSRSHRACMLFAGVIAAHGCGVVTMPSDNRLELEADAAPAGSDDPRFLFDGGGACEEMIAFHSDRHGSEDIFVVNPDGTGTKRLTDDPAIDYGATWSPDGAWLVFTSWRDGRDQIYAMAADGSGQINLGNSEVGDESPSLSADGQQIVYLHGGTECYVMNADGSVQRELAACTYQSFAKWSPDSARIAYAMNSQIYAVNADGSNPTRLSDGSGNARTPRWSPSGDRIAFVKTVDGNAEVYVMDADGTASTRLTMSDGDDLEPAWSPDGQWLVFRSQRDGDEEIYVMSAVDGTGLVNLTSSPGDDSTPAWRRCAP